MEEVIDLNGIRITVTNIQTPDGTWEAYFSNAPGNFDFLHHVKALRGLESKEAAIEAGKKFVNEHQWQYIEDFKLFSIYVRLWWNDDWGYSIRYGASESKGNFHSQEEAISAAKKRITDIHRQYKRKLSSMMLFDSKKQASDKNNSSHRK